MRDAVTDMMMAASRWRIGNLIAGDGVSRLDGGSKAAASTAFPEDAILIKVQHARYMELIEKLQQAIEHERSKVEFYRQSARAAWVSGRRNRESRWNLLQQADQHQFKLDWYEHVMQQWLARAARLLYHRAPAGEGE